MQVDRTPLPLEEHTRLKRYVYDIISCLQYVHNDLGPALPEYVYQEALAYLIGKQIVKPLREYQYNPVFDGKILNSFVKMDLVVPMPSGNVIIECKSISKLSERERFQTFGYLRATNFPFAILVNFGTWPKAEIERYYWNNGIIRAF